MSIRRRSRAAIVSLAIVGGFVLIAGGRPRRTDELHADIVENDAGDIVMRLKDRKEAITFHRASGASGPKAYKKLKAILDQAPPKQSAGSQP